MCFVWDLEWIFRSNLIKISVTASDHYAPLMLISNHGAAVSQTRNISLFFLQCPKAIMAQSIVCVLHLSDFILTCFIEHVVIGLSHKSSC